jgi:hypothetical protein
MDLQEPHETRPPLLEHLATFVAAHARALTSLGFFLGGNLSGYALAHGHHDSPPYEAASVVSLPRKAPAAHTAQKPKPKPAAKIAAKPKAAPKKAAAKPKDSDKSKKKKTDAKKS